MDETPPKTDDALQKILIKHLFRIDYDLTCIS